ncbi:MAG: hypothetical protein U0984_03050 [Prosthecobacter sp.]|nr:hypothetical protein [Prosthecobacter sp.]
MPLSALATVLLRVLGLHWIVTGTVSVLSAALFYSKRVPFEAGNFIGATGPLLLGVLLWFVSPALSRKVTRGYDDSLSLQGVTREDLYATALLAFGLYFAVSSLGQTLSWIHYFTTNHHQTFDFVIRSSSSYYELAKPLITFAAGIGLTLSAKVWARKLA